jgi:hypothetical protein
VSKLIAESMHASAVRWLAIRPVGGAVNDVDPFATAYAHRHQNFAVADVGIREAPFRAHCLRVGGCCARTWTGSTSTSRATSARSVSPTLTPARR